MDNYSTPINGRYAAICDDVMSILGEENITYTKVKVSLKWALYVYEQMTGDRKHRNFKLDSMFRTLGQVKRIERDTKHDIAAIVEYLKSVLPSEVAKYVHVGLTSQDIVSLSSTVLVKDVVKIMSGHVNELIGLLDDVNTDGYMIGRTHGQLGSPIEINTVICVYKIRIRRALASLELNSMNSMVKFSGSMGDKQYMKIQLGVGSFRCNELIDGFLASLGVVGSDDASFQSDWWYSLSMVISSVKHLALVLKNVSMDMWHYSSHGDLIRTPSDKEVGSSAMPHKVNPITFENCEGNCKIVIGLCDTLVNELSVSRMQRDLSDSTMIRNIYLVFSHMAIAINSLSKGVCLYRFNTDKIRQDMIDNPYIFSEHVYSMLRNLVIGDHLSTQVDLYAVVKECFRQKGGSIDDMLLLVENKLIDLIGEEDISHVLDIDTISGSVYKIMGDDI